MEPHKARAAAAFAALTDKLYASSRGYTYPGGLDPFVLWVGPQLLRKPWLRQYYDPAILCEIYTAMHRCEDLYPQMHDLVALLRLQFAPITPALQRDVSQYLWQEYGLSIPAQHVVDMTDYECWAAITRLTSFLAEKAPDWEAVWYYAWHVPMVLCTAYEEHAVRDASGKTVNIQPTKLPLEHFVWWFRQRLLLAVKTRLEKYPNNPLWVLPNGAYRDVRTPTPQEWGDFGALMQDVCRPVHRGRPKGSGTYHDTTDFMSKVLPVMCNLIREGQQPTQEEVAPYLNTTDRQLRDWVRDFHLTWNDIRQRAYRLCTGSDFSS